jgi:hypothetical protein
MIMVNMNVKVIHMREDLEMVKNMEKEYFLTKSQMRVMRESGLQIK